MTSAAVNDSQTVTNTGAVDKYFKKFLSMFNYRDNFLFSGLSR